MPFIRNVRLRHVTTGLILRVALLWSLVCPILLRAQEPQPSARFTAKEWGSGDSISFATRLSETESIPQAFELAQVAPPPGGGRPGAGGAQPANAITLGTYATNVGSMAGTSSVELVSTAMPSSTRWVAISNDSWLHVAEASSSGSASALIQFSYDANPGAVVRTGTLTIAGLTFTVMQAGANATAVVSLTKLVSTGLTSPQGIATDAAGDIYIADGGANSILLWSAATQQIATLISGLNEPLGVAVDSAGNVFVADTLNNAVEKWSPSMGLQTLVNSGLYYPSGVAVDSSDNVFIANTDDSELEEFQASSGQVILLPSSGLNFPFGLALDGLQNIYIANVSNNAVDQFSMSTGQLTALVSSGLSDPTGIAVDGQGNVYFADSHHNVIDMWSPATGQNSTIALTGRRVDGVAVDLQGNVYFSESLNQDIQEISFIFMPLTLTETASSGTDSIQVLATAPFTPTSDQGWLTINGMENGTITFSFQANTSISSRVAHISLLGQQITITQSGYLPTLAKSAGDNQSAVVGTPFSTALQIAMSDSNGQPITGVGVSFTTNAGAGGAGGTFAGSATVTTDANGLATAPTLTANSIPGQFTVTASAGNAAVTFALANLPPVFTLGDSSIAVGSAAGTSNVLLTAVPSSASWTASSNPTWLHVSSSGAGDAPIPFSYDANSGTTARTGTVTIAGSTLTVTQAGTNFIAVYPMIPLVQAVSDPVGVAVDRHGNVYIGDTGDAAIKEWSPITQQVTTLASGLELFGVAVDSQGNVYAAGFGSHVVNEWNVGTQQLNTLIGSGLFEPAGVAVDGQGNVYVADNYDINMWSPSTQQLTIAVPPTGSAPFGVAVDARANVYIADTYANAIKVLNQSTQSVSVPVSSGLNHPQGVAVDGQGNIYIADSGNNAIEEWNATTQQVTTLVSSGLNSPSGVAVDGQGNVYIADSGNNVVEKRTSAWLSLATTTITESASGGSDSAAVQILPATVPLTATSDQSWLTITGVSGGVINFSVQANTAPSTRTAHIAVLGQIITVNQSGYVGPPAFVLKENGDIQSAIVSTAFAAPLEVQITDSNGTVLGGLTVAFTITAGPNGAGATFGGTATVTTSANGIAVSPPLTANSTAGPFTVTASVNSLSATFTLANIPAFTLGASSLTAGSTAGSGTVTLAAALSNAAWTATSNATWLHLSSSSGTGNASVGFTYDTNSTSAARTGTLTIAGLTLTVAQAGAGFVEVYPVTTLVSGLNQPEGVAVDAQGNVYVANANGNVVDEWSPATQQLTLLTVQPTPNGLAIDVHGNLFIADANPALSAVEEWSTTLHQGDTIIQNPMVQNPSGVAVDGQGNAYIAATTQKSILEWNAATKLSTTLITGLNQPIGVAADVQGNVYIADAVNNTISEWTRSTGTLTTLVSSGLSDPNGVAVDMQGNVYIADSGNAAVKEWNANTQQVTTLISSGVGVPNLLTLDTQGSLYISDTYNNAIHKMTPTWLSLGAANMTESASAGTDSVALQVLPAGTALNPTSDQSWLTITSATNGTIGFSFQANTLTSSRAAHITVLGQQITVTQNADTAAALTKVAGDSQSTAAGTPFATALQVKVTDSNGAPLSGISVTFAAVAGSSSASGAFSATSTVTTDANGLGTAPALTANMAAGQFAVTAAAGNLSATFTLTNLAAMATLQPANLSFGNQNLGTTSATQSVMLSNPGNAPLSIIGIALSGTNAGDFSQTNTCGSGIAAGGSCTIAVKFMPQAAGARSALVTVTDNAATSLQTASLAGTGVAIPQIALTSSSLAFGNQNVGTTSTTRSITLSNSGTGALSISNIAIAGTDPGDFSQTNTCGSGVAAGGSCTVSIKFTPKAAGARSASLTVTDNAGASPQTASLTGTGVAVPQIVLTPSSLAFGNQNVGTNSAARNIILSNPGTAALSINSIALTGTNAGDFSMTSTCGSGVPTGGSCTISIRFRPLAAGARSASLKVTDNASASRQTATLAGTGVAVP